MRLNIRSSLQASLTSNIARLNRMIQMGAGTKIRLAPTVDGAERWYTANDEDIARAHRTKTNLSAPLTDAYVADVSLRVQRRISRLRGMI